ncbi:MAG: hypothetical protein Q8876_01105 [Bacillota bacterium]|nr:hypothetical protein [Bacillota bacterium]
MNRYDKHVPLYFDFCNHQKCVSEVNKSKAVNLYGLEICPQCIDKSINNFVDEHPEIYYKFLRTNILDFLNEYSGDYSVESIMVIPYEIGITGSLLIDVKLDFSIIEHFCKNHWAFEIFVLNELY